ncbi:MAG: CopD family protein [Neobacillus sp.]
MLIVSIISDAMLYLCFALLVGSFLLQLIPPSLRPTITIPKGVLLIATLGIVFFSFMPVLKLVLYLYEDLGLSYTLKSVLTTFETGKSWIITGVLSLFLFIYLIPIKLERNPVFAVTGLLFTLLLIAVLGWSSHASSLAKPSGFLIHSAHFLAITIWVGVLLVVSWFSRDYKNWLNFLKWFSPLATLCLIVTGITGIALMTFVMDLTDYMNTWPLSYGQALLIKHIAIIPLVMFALINSVLIRRKIQKDETFNPLPWAKFEGMVVLLIFSITAALGQEAPPHSIERTLNSEGVSKLFSFFHPKELVLPIHFSPGLLSIGLFLIALFSLALSVFTFIQKKPKWLALWFSILFIVTSYIGLLVSI